MTVGHPSDPHQWAAQNQLLGAVALAELLRVDVVLVERALEVDEETPLGILEWSRRRLVHRGGSEGGQGALVGGVTFTSGVTPSAPLPFTITVLLLFAARTSRSIWM